MREDNKTTIICIAFVCATIIGWAYIAYNPKVCPTGPAEKSWYKEGGADQ